MNNNFFYAFIPFAVIAAFIGVTKVGPPEISILFTVIAGILFVLGIFLKSPQ